MAILAMTLVRSLITVGWVEARNPAAISHCNLINAVKTMPIPLSTRTNTLAETLFDEPMQSRVKQTLLDSGSENIPFCNNETPEGMDRIRFSVMKLINENGDNFATTTLQP
ncbi:MAG: hypothetical protein F6K19_52080 [Cyanothece sp. SIO1E1]|nr:hypothetical protein [Cyanothece sp. SIO1E1]